MQRHDTGTQAAIECRRYWRDGRVTDHEWWQGGQMLLEPPANVAVLTSDYCEAHRTRIYPDLGCQFCRERPRLTLRRPRRSTSVRPTV